MVAVPQTTTQNTEYPPCETLKRVRIEKGLTQADLAVMVIRSGHKITSGYISGFELGSRKTWPSARKAISSTLGMGEGELFPEIS